MRTGRRKGRGRVRGGREGTGGGGTTGRGNKTGTGRGGGGRGGEGGGMRGGREGEARRYGTVERFRRDEGESVPRDLAGLIGYFQHNEEVDVVLPKRIGLE
jgi:hypothetical protein